jgi:hypothetical protein
VAKRCLAKAMNFLRKGSDSGSCTQPSSAGLDQTVARPDEVSFARGLTARSLPHAAGGRTLTQLSEGEIQHSAKPAPISTLQALHTYPCPRQTPASP